MYPNASDFNQEEVGKLRREIEELRAVIEFVRPNAFGDYKNKQVADREREEFNRAVAKPWRYVVCEATHPSPHMVKSAASFSNRKAFVMAYGEPEKVPRESKRPNLSGMLRDHNRKPPPMEVFALRFNTLDNKWERVN